MADVFEELKTHYADDDRVTVASGRGAQGIKSGKKMFAMFYKGNLLLKLPPERVQSLIAEGRGEPYDAGTGSPMKDRVLCPPKQKDDWIELCEEALRFARGE